MPPGFRIDPRRATGPPRWYDAAVAPALRAFILAAAALAIACAPLTGVYRPPARAEPHAEVDVEIVTAVPPRTAVEREVRLGGAEVAREDQDGQPSWGTFARVRPGPSTWTLRVTRFALEQVPVSETWTEHVSYGCVGGPSLSCMRPVTRTRTRWETRRRPTGGCSRELSVVVEADAVYLLRLTSAGGACEAQCFLQVPVGGDEYELRPCPNTL